MLRPRQKLGKYRVCRRLARGGFGDVYEADDTIEGIRVALKIPNGALTDNIAADFRREARLTARLNHAHILPVKNADFVHDMFVIVYPLGLGTLADRLSRRLSARAALDFTGQLLGALAHAHERHVIHCDVKPENLIMFPGDVVRLSDFGIARVAARTVQASGSGSLGYIAPEQAMGRPSARSDVFSAGLVTYRMLTGHLPRWPFRPPLPGHERLRRFPPELHKFLQRALSVEPRKRFRDAVQMEATFLRIKPKVLTHLQRQRKRRAANGNGKPRDWRAIRLAQFRRRFAKAVRLDARCSACHEPIDERMHACPWCGETRHRHEGDVSMPARCPRCDRGVKLDWRYCPWCFGASIGPISNRSYSDRRYSARCNGPRCDRKLLMPFMRYCPWCKAKVHSGWETG